MKSLFFLLNSLFIILILGSHTPIWGNNYKKAQNYFKGRQIHEEEATLSRGSHMMSLYYAPFLENRTYAWGKKGQTHLHHSLGFTYLIQASPSLWDFNLRSEMSFYRVENKKISKLSIFPLLTLPEVATAFPIYFGLGVGPGFFFEQIGEESYLSLDYQILVGLRWINLWPRIGFFLEYGLKNSIHLLDDGQVNATFVSLGGIFIF